MLGLRLRLCILLMVVLTPISSFQPTSVRLPFSSVQNLRSGTRTCQKHVFLQQKAAYGRSKLHMRQLTTVMSIVRDVAEEVTIISLWTNWIGSTFRLPQHLRKDHDEVSSTAQTSRTSCHSTSHIFWRYIASPLRRKWVILSPDRNRHSTALTDTKKQSDLLAVVQLAANPLPNRPDGTVVVCMYTSAYDASCKSYEAEFERYWMSERLWLQLFAWSFCMHACISFLLFIRLCARMCVSGWMWWSVNASV
jgi:hypothetical protein